jgi:hypothetical protein
MDSKFSREEYLKEYYETGGKPKVFKRIPCTVTGKLVNMFGDNLARRLKQYGSIENLLDTFVSREGKQGTAPPKVKKDKPKTEKVKPEKIKKPKPEKKHRLLQRATKRARGAKKEAIEEAMTGDLKIPNRNYPPYDIKNPLHIEELTRYSCVRPDIFLDCGRICNFCPYNVYCIAPCKNIVSEQKAQKQLEYKRKPKK